MRQEGGNMDKEMWEEIGENMGCQERREKRRRFKGKQPFKKCRTNVYGGLRKGFS